MKKYLLIICTIFAFLPVHSYADTSNTGWYLGSSVDLLNLKTPVARKPAKKYLGKSTMDGNSFSIGYKGKKWGIRAGKQRLNISSRSPVSSMQNSLDIPSNISGSNIVDFNGSSSMTLGQIISASPTASGEVNSIIRRIPGSVAVIGQLARVDINIEQLLQQGGNFNLDIPPIMGILPVEASFNASTNELDYNVDLQPFYDRSTIGLSLDVDIYYLDVIRYWQPTKDIGLYAGAGLGMAYAKATAVFTFDNNLSYTETFKEDSLIPKIIFGSSYSFSKKFEASTEITFITTKDYILSAGVNYYF